MHKRKAVYFFVLALVWLMAGVVFTGNSALAQPPGAPPTPVVAAPVVEKMAAPGLDIVGTARANRISRVAAEVAGLVTSIYFNEGDLIHSGAVLVELDKTNEKLGLEATRAQLTGAMAQLEEARKKLKRSSSLKKTKAISDQSMEKDFFRVRVLEATVAGIQAQEAKLNYRLGRMSVRAPFTGYIVEKHTEAGQWVGPGSLVATLAELTTIKVAGSLPERYITRIKAGDKAKVMFDALGPGVFEGQVTSVIPAADEKSRNFPVEISLENRDGTIKAGLLARVSLTGTKRKVLLVPKDALVLGRAKPTVFVVRDNTVFPVAVTVGEAYGEDVEITGDLIPGQMVVIKGNERLRPKQQVQIISPQDPGHSAVQ